jgi:hypothetical protein
LLSIASFRPHALAKSNANPAPIFFDEDYPLSG